MTPSLRTFLPRCAGVLLVVALGCDASAPEPDVEQREGQTATFKTANTDASFKWKGCEPPWGPDPYHQGAEPTEQWRADVGARIAPDAAAQVLADWREASGAKQCDEGCASLELAWTGGARVEDLRSELGRTSALGECDERALAWSIDVAVTSSVVCSCG